MRAPAVTRRPSPSIRADLLRKQSHGYLVGSNRSNSVTGCDLNCVGTGSS
jgi:hypothetical protein